uniref:Uncharacterized protein n=1 Tax=Cacopsylla melanoneura TaxID=428564 RepID=A0A8D9EEE3_9HEMI
MYTSYCMSVVLQCLLLNPNSFLRRVYFEQIVQCTLRIVCMSVLSVVLQCLLLTPNSFLRRVYFDQIVQCTYTSYCMYVVQPMFAQDSPTAAAILKDILKLGAF